MILAENLDQGVGSGTGIGREAEEARGAGDHSESQQSLWSDPNQQGFLC
jgi:hypothetical protein